MEKKFVVAILLQGHVDELIRIDGVNLKKKKVAT
jgi:hypothetical protein